MSGESHDPPANRRRVRELIARCLDGVATEAETAELDGLVAREPAVAHELAGAALLESSLEVVSRGAKKAADIVVLPVRRRFFARRGALLLVAAALAISSVGLALIAARPWVRAPAPNDATTGSRAPGALPKTRAAEGTAVAKSPSELVTDVPTEAEGPASGAAPNPPRTTPAETPSARAAKAADSLQAANQLRRQGRWAEAERAYARIATGYAGTSQGSVAALAAASLRLEHLGDPRGALRLYQSVRSPAVSVEAELGIADCYRALGDRQGEIAALNRLVKAHPKALSSERAMKRLETLQSGKP